MNAPLLSIVIANYNYGRFLAEAIGSIISQVVGDRVEIVICDGGSTDDSVEIIKKYNDKISWWCSEKDSGQSEAFNKGFAHARGRYLTWLNADDVFCEGAIKAILDAIKKHPDCEWFTGNFLRFLPNGDVCEIGWGPHGHPEFLQRKDSPLVIFGPSTIFSKRIWEQVGRIDESMHLMMDTDLWMRFVTAGVKLRRINHFIWAFRMHEQSKTAEFGSHSLDENKRRRFAEERDRAYSRSGYRCSRLMRVICLLWRVLDLSLLRKAWYELTLRHFCPTEAGL